MSAPALDALARAARTNPDVRTALQRWAIATRQTRVQRLLAVAAPVDVALRAARPALGPHTSALSAAAILSERTGCPFAPSVSALAHAAERDARRRASGRSAAAAARASARGMVFLPIVLVPVLALFGVPVTGGSGAGALLVGGALSLCAWRWIDRLVPDPPLDDAGIVFAERVAVALESGIDLGRACDHAAAYTRRALAPSLRLATHGVPWPLALCAHPHPFVRHLGELLGTAVATGAPVAGDLKIAAAARRARADARFEEVLRVAPVKMVAPLVTCSLPAFLLTTIAPLVAAIGAGAFDR